MTGGNGGRDVPTRCRPSILPFQRDFHDVRRVTCADAQLSPEVWRAAFQPGGGNESGLLRVYGPVCDGFWVKALMLLKAADWAVLRGLQPRFVLSSHCDPYLPPIARSGGVATTSTHNLWAHYFDDGHDREKLHVPMRTKPFALDEVAAFWLYSMAPGPAYPRTYSEAGALRKQRAVSVRHWLRPASRVQNLARRAWEEMVGDASPILGVHVRGTDKRIGKRVAPTSYIPYIEAWLGHYPRARAFIATDDAAALDGLLRRFGTTRLAFQAHANRSACSKGTNAADPDCAFANPMSRGGGGGGGGGGLGGLGDAVMLDTLLLARCDFLLKPASAVSEFAIYYSGPDARLHARSYDFELPDQPPPTGVWWTTRSSHV